MLSRSAGVLSDTRLTGPYVREHGSHEGLCAYGFHGRVLSVVTALRDTSFEIRDSQHASCIPELASRFSYPVSRYSYFKSNRLSLSVKLHSAAVDCQIQVQPAFPNKPPSGRIQIFQERPIHRIRFALAPAACDLVRAILVRAEE